MCTMYVKNPFLRTIYTCTNSESEREKGHIALLMRGIHCCIFHSAKWNVQHNSICCSVCVCVLLFLSFHFRLYLVFILDVHSGFGSYFCCCYILLQIKHSLLLLLLLLLISFLLLIFTSKCKLFPPSLSACLNTFNKT